MRIVNITLQNFRCFNDLELNFDKPINFIFGPNASGKSTIAEAMEMALTGRCNGFNPNWRDRAALVRHGADAFKIALDIDGDRSPLGSAPIKKVIHRLEPKDCSPKPDAIAKKLNVSKEALASLFDTGHFFTLHPDEKKRLIFDLLDLRVTKANIKRKLKSWLKEHPGLIEKHRIDPDSDLLSILGPAGAGSPDSLEAAYSQAFDERRLVKRELKAVGPIVDIPEGITPEEVQSRIDKGQAELASLYTRAGEVRGIGSEGRKQIEREIKEITSKIAELGSDIPGFRPSTESRKVAKLEGRKADALNYIRSLNEDLKRLEKQISTLEAKESERKVFQARVAKFNGFCPMLDGIECKTSEVLAAISDIQRASDENLQAEAEKNRIRQAMEQTSMLIKKEEKGLQEIDEHISECKRRIERHEDAKRCIDELKTRKAKAERKLQECDEGKVEESLKLKAQIKELETEMEKNRRLLQAVQREGKRKALKGKLAILEVLVQAFSPKGIMADLLSKAVKSLNESLAETMKKLTSGPPAPLPARRASRPEGSSLRLGEKYSLEMSINDDVDIHLIHPVKSPKGGSKAAFHGVNHHKGLRTNIKLASSSERFRAGIVIQSVLSGLTGLRFMLIDGLDILDQENKGFFFRFIQEVKKNFDNIFVFCTIGQYQPQNPDLPDIDFWVIEEGNVRKIPASLRKAA